MLIHAQRSKDNNYAIHVWHSTSLCSRIFRVWPSQWEVELAGDLCGVIAIKSPELCSSSENKSDSGRKQSQCGCGWIVYMLID